MLMHRMIVDMIIGMVMVSSMDMLIGIMDMLMASFRHRHGFYGNAMLINHETAQIRAQSHQSAHQGGQDKKKRIGRTLNGRPAFKSPD